ncbi:MAG: HNH endonuclease [Spirochaetaceae bacterium]|nr:HNH endonuclease [Spirochaetaceae bacterium]
MGCGHHHLKPVSESGIVDVDPKSDMAVLCANCHAMIHRRRDSLLSINELKKMTNLED